MKELSSVIDISGRALWWSVLAQIYAVIPAGPLTVGGLYIHAPLTIGLALSLVWPMECE